MSVARHGFLIASTSLLVACGGDSASSDTAQPDADLPRVARLEALLSTLSADSMEGRRVPQGLHGARGRNARGDRGLRAGLLGGPAFGKAHNCRDPKPEYRPESLTVRNRRGVGIRRPTSGLP